MDSTTLLVVGGFLVLIGLLNLIRTRVVRVRERLSPAASIRTRSLGAYSPGQSATGRSLSVLLMLGGGAVVLAAILTRS